MSDSQHTNPPLSAHYRGRDYEEAAVLPIPGYNYYLLLPTENFDGEFLFVLDLGEEGFMPIEDPEQIENLFFLTNHLYPDLYKEKFSRYHTVTRADLDALEQELNIKIVTACPRLIPEDALTTIRRLHYYMGGKNCCVITDAFCGVTTDADSVANVTDAARHRMNAVMSYHPDFHPLMMDDGNWLLTMQGTAFCCHAPWEILHTFHNDESTAFRVPFSAALAMRSECMKACDEERILAIVYCNPDDYYSFNEQSPNEESDNEEEA